MTKTKDVTETGCEAEIKPGKETAQGSLAAGRLSQAPAPTGNGQKGIYPLWQRLLAVFGLLLLFGALLGLILTLATSRDPGTLLAFLFVLMVVPCIFYLFRWVRDLRKKL